MLCPSSVHFAAPMKQLLLLVLTAIAGFVLALAFSSWHQGFWRPNADVASASQSAAVAHAKPAVPPLVARPIVNATLAVTEDSRAGEGQPALASSDAATRSPAVHADPPEFFTAEPRAEPRSSRTR